MLNKISRVSLVLILTIVLAAFLWWHYGNPVSEQTALNLATDFVQDYANRNNIDLTNYNKPKIEHVGRFYTFSWLPKVAGKPFVITIDAMAVDISVDEFPN